MSIFTAAKSLGLSAIRGGWGAGKAGFGLGVTVGKAGMGSATFALNNPYATLGLAGAGLGLYGLANSGPGQSDLSVDQMSALVSNNGYSSTGFAPGMGTGYRQESRAMFMDSAAGLVQGLNRRRHGG